jgi:hypothetical protein
MRRTATLLASLGLILAVAGCRDVLVDPQPIPQAPQGPAGAQSLYLKGPTTLGVTSSGNYRAEFISGVDHYEWRALGEGTVSIGFPYGDTRLPVITGSTVGPVDLVAEAYDANGVVIGIAFKPISVR